MARKSKKTAGATPRGFAAVTRRTRWFPSVVVAATMVATIAIFSLQVAYLAEAKPILLEKRDGNSGTAIQEAAAATNDESIDCSDDLEFRFKDDDKKDCDWVEKKNLDKRCNKKDGGKTIAESCQETCDFELCRTIRDNKNKLKVGVYYYPWWGEDFHRGNPDDPDLYLRSQLTGPQQLPKLGEYDDRQKEVINKHLKWSRDYNIDLWVTSWWGKDRREDLNIKDNILTNKKIGDTKISIFYETTGRIREKENYDLKNVRSDLEYLCQEYFDHPNYYKTGIDADGKADASSTNTRPVLFVYLTRKLENLEILPEAIALMREGARDGGCGEIFIVGDQVFQGPPKNEEDLIPFDLLDAVTNYDVYGSMRGEQNLGYIGNRENVNDYYLEQNEWRALAKERDCVFVPAVSPGFNDRGVRPEIERIPLSRRLNEDEPEGSLFEAALEEARKLVDPAIGNLIMVNSMNEWHEDTQIEPCIAVGGETGSTSLPTNLTYGLEYEGYGNLYLKILKEETEAWDPSMVVSYAASSMRNPAMETTTVYGGDPYSIVTISDTIGWELE